LLFLAIYYSGDKSEKDVMGRACSTCGVEVTSIWGFWWGGLRERGHLEDLGIDGRIILRWILEKWFGKALTLCIWLQLVGFYERGDETWGSLKCVEFLD